MRINCCLSTLSALFSTTRTLSSFPYVRRHVDAYAERLDGVLHLIGDVQRVSVEEDNNAVGAVGEVVDDLGEVICAVQTLLLAGENSGSIDEGDRLQHLGTTGIKVGQSKNS